MAWTHAILEIYSPESGWPKSGTPTDWISESLVGYCDGELEHVVLFTPLLNILRWKLKNAISNIWWTLTWRFHKYD